MKFLSNVKLSEHRYKDNSGYLICTDCILARTGKQTYTKRELGIEDSDEEVEVDRPLEEVSNPTTIISFENKPITVEHPNEDVTPDNINSLGHGFARDIHMAKRTIDGKEYDCMVGNIVITDANAIQLVENGLDNLSCGYDCDIEEENGQYKQVRIRGNHIALCQSPRAGITRIMDSKVKDKLVGNGEVHFLYEGPRIMANVWNKNNKDVYELEDIAKKYGCKVKPMNGRWNDVWLIGKKGEEEKLCKAWNEINPNYTVEELLALHDSKTKDDNKTCDAEVELYWDDYDHPDSWKEDAKKYNLTAKIVRMINGYPVIKFIGNRKDLEKLVLIVDEDAINTIKDSKTCDASNHSFRLDKRKNDYDEYVVKEYVNGKFREEGSYYTDDWDDAVGTLKDIAKRSGLNVRQNGSGFIADCDDAFNPDITDAVSYSLYSSEGDFVSSFKTIQEANEAKKKLKSRTGNSYYVLEDSSHTGVNNVIRTMDNVKDSHKCCICGKMYEGYGNNPWPVKQDGRCCDKCNEEKVIPARLAHSALRDAVKITGKTDKGHKFSYDIGEKELIITYPNGKQESRMYETWPLAEEYITCYLKDSKEKQYIITHDSKEYKVYANNKLEAIKKVMKVKDASAYTFKVQFNSLKEELEEAKDMLADAKWKGFQPQIVKPSTSNSTSIYELHLDPQRYSKDKASDEVKDFMGEWFLIEA